MLRFPLLAAALLVLAQVAPAQVAPAQFDDPLAEVYAKEVRSSVESLIEHYRRTRRYKTADFPMPAARFGEFRRETVENLVSSLDMEDWQVRNPRGKTSPIADLYRDRVVKRFVHDGVEMEAHVIEILATGDQVPAVLSLPKGTDVVPGVACYPGHGQHGLRGLVFEYDSYQKAVAAQLAKAGIASIAVEKIDTGYLSRTAPSGLDEEEIASFRLGLGSYTRAVQLMAGLAALEVLAAHPRVDETRIGATGVSLGGWLAIQTALFSDRVQAVAEYSMKTVFLPDEMTPEQFAGVGDMCHLIPGTFAVGDRNLHIFAYAPRPLLSGHGGPTDRGSHGQYEQYYKSVLEKQYRALGRESDFRYHMHDGGHATHPETVIAYFREVLGSSQKR